MTSNYTDVSVIISAYTEKRWDQTVAAVQSALEQSLPPREIVLCIDHNPVLLERALARFDHTPPIRVIANTEARGVSGARNSGVAVASGTVVAFLDDDAEAAHDWLERLTAGYADPHVLGVGGSIESFWLAGRPAWFPPEFEWVVGCSYRGLPGKTTPLRNMIGANMSFRRARFLEVGGFRTGIGRVGDYPPVGCEDTALCIAARQRWPWGIVLHEPRARVRHAVPPSKSLWSYYVSRCYGEGLSKAKLAQLYGRGDSLVTEGTYVFRTLPTGVALAMWEAIIKRDAARLTRAGAIVAGLASAAIGFGVTWLGRRPSARQPVTLEAAS